MTTPQELLQAEIEYKRKEMLSERQDLTIGELKNLYEDNELIINPEFQRFFKWTIEQKSKLIESILLNFPLPPIFIFERKDGKWEVVDGLQRLSSVFEFMGILKQSDGKKMKKTILGSVPYLTHLEGMSWDDLSDPQQRYIKRATFSIIKLKFDSQEFTKYELFQRLNRGGTPLTEQEIRNCIIVQNNPDFFYWMLDKLSKNKHFVKTCCLSDKKIEDSENLNLVTRFLVFKHSSIEELKSVERVDEFLNKKIIEISLNKTFDYKAEKHFFDNVFSKLFDQLGDKTFKKYSQKSQEFKGGFSLSVYEGIIYAMVQKNASFNNLKEKAIKLQNSETFKKYSGSGISVKSRWGHILDIANEIFNNA